MKRTGLSLLSLLLVLSLACGLCGSVFAADDGRTGLSFTAADLYQTRDPLDAWPHTWEAWVKVEKNAGSGRLGVIVGNYASSGSPSANMEIRTNGNPALWWSSGSGKTSNRTVSFTDVDLRTGEWTFLTLTNTETEVKCYVNGVLKQTVSADIYPMDDSKMKVMCLGGDLRSANAQNLKQTVLQTAAVYSEVRTEAQIAADMAGFDPGAPGILGAWDLSAAGSARLSDLSGKGKSLTYTNTADPSLNEPKQEDGPAVDADDGLSFTAGRLYRTEKAFSAMPQTLEATLWFPKTASLSERGGVILGNYGGVTECVSFEIYTNGNPRLYYVDKAGTVYNCVFGNVNVCTGQWVNLAIVKDNAKGTLSCYVDGVLKQTLTKTCVDVLPPSVIGIGGDLRSGNGQFFRGRLKDINVYSAVRTAAELAGDAQNPGKDPSGLMLSYSASGTYGENFPATLQDAAGHGYDAKKIEREWWFTDKEPVKDYAYSFAVIGDTQNMNASHPEGFPKIFDWILANAESKKIKFVMGLGDITNNDTEAEWNRAAAQFQRMDGIVPYSLVIGNHDSTAKFKQAVNYKSYTDTLEGTYGDSLANTWRTLTVGERKYLILTLEYGANDAVLAWAGKVIEDHPDCNVILTTHCYLFRDGTTLDAGDVVPPSKKGSSYNNGDQMWDKLVSRYPNIVLVLSGHDPCDQVVLTQTKGINGNTVSQILSDHQTVDKNDDGAGMITMLYFSADGKTVQVECFSPVRGQYYMTDNQYSFTLDVVQADSNATTAEVTTDAPAGTTDAPAGEPTAPVATEEAPGETTDAPVTAPQTEPAKETGCGSVISAAPLLLLLPAAVLHTRRKKD